MNNYPRTDAVWDINTLSLTDVKRYLLSLELEIEVSELKRDAERYRWLEQHFFEYEEDDATAIFKSCRICHSVGETLGNAIDRHIEEESKNG